MDDWLAEIEKNEKEELQKLADEYDRNKSGISFCQLHADLPRQCRFCL